MYIYSFVEKGRKVDDKNTENRIKIQNHPQFMIFYAKK